MSRAARLVTVLATLLLMQWWPTTGAQAVQPDEVLKNPVLERQAREISTELRCLVCQNQSIDDSDAPLAHDLRVIVRERLQAGDSHQAVIDYVVARYGEFILLRPRLSAKTLILWAAPLLLLSGGLLMAFRLFRHGGRPGDVANASLSAREQTELREVLERTHD